MKGLFNYDGYLNRIMGKIMYIVSANLLFLLGSIPIITVGASSVAMYTVLIKYMEGDEPDILRTFWSAFRLNFKKATILWSSMLLIALTLVMNCFYILQKMELTNFMQITVNLFFILWLLTWIYVMPAMAYYENSLGGYLKFSYRLAIAKLPRTVLLVFVNSIPLVILILLTYISAAAVMTLVICGFSLPAYWCLKILLPLFSQYGEKEYDEKVES